MNYQILQILAELVSLNLYQPLDYSALDSNRYAVREKAERALSASWPTSDSTLRAAIKNGSPHVKERAKEIRDECFAKSLSDCGTAPWADFLLWDVAGNRWDHSQIPGLQRAIQRSMTRTESHPWSNYREVTIKWADSALRSGVPPTLIRFWFAAGRNVDAEYAKSAAPPIDLPKEID